MIVPGKATLGFGLLLPLLVLLVLSFRVQADSNALPSTMEVFYTNNTLPQRFEGLKEQGIAVEIYNLDAHTNMETDFSVGLPVNDMTRAKAMVLERLQAAEKTRAFNTLFLGAVKSRRYDLKKVPAIVFNAGESVIYGVADGEKALNHWQQRQAQHLGQQGEGDD